MIYRLFYKFVCVFLCFICLGSAYAADTLEQPSSQEPQKAVSSADSQKAPSIELVEQPPSQESREATSSVAESKAPSIQVPESTHDFGEVPEGEIISHDFKVKNVGEGVLKIEQVRPG